MIEYDKWFSRNVGSMQGSAIRQMGSVAAQAADVISFAPGYPAEDDFPWRACSEVATELLAGSDGSVLQYGPTRGYRPLRELLAGLMATRNIRAPADRLLVTSGSQQGLDLVARVLLDPGDVALLELPSYTGAIAAFRNVGASLVGVKQDEEGIDLDHLDHVWTRLTGEGRRVKFVYVVPNFQNPSGTLLPLARRRQLLEWAERRDLLIVEDDPYGDLYFSELTESGRTRPIVSDDPDGRVLYISSFSKTLAPGFRVAWVAGPETVVGKLELAKQAADLCTGVLDQRIVYEACRRGVLATQLPQLRAHYEHKRNVMNDVLSRLLSGQASWSVPRGGFFLWLQLREPLQSEAVLAAARRHGVLFVIGSAFFVNGAGQSHLRLSFSAPAPARIEAGVTRLAAAIEAVLHGDLAESTQL